MACTFQYLQAAGCSSINEVGPLTILTIMGNCIANSHLRQSKRRATYDDDDENLLENMEYQKPGRRLLAKKFNLPTCQKVSKHNGTQNRQRVKVVLTRKQLQLLITGANELKCTAVPIRSIRDGYLKWRPSLATIPEL